ncbi:hypothetical protein D3C85_1667290 [compost metagenome]
MLGILIDHNAGINTGILPFGADQTIRSCRNGIGLVLGAFYILEQIGSRPVRYPVGPWQNACGAFGPAFG